MTREEVVFRANYSYFIETMHATLYGRIDKLITFTQLLLGSAVFASLGNPIYIGAIIAVVSAVSFTWQFAKSAMVCETQAIKMKSLIGKTSLFSDDELLSGYLRAEETDSPVLGVLRDAAQKRTHIVLGQYEQASKIKLTVMESFVSWLAGDCPKGQ